MQQCLKPHGCGDTSKTVLKIVCFGKSVFCRKNRDAPIVLNVTVILMISLHHKDYWLNGQQDLLRRSSFLRYDCLSFPAPDCTTPPSAPSHIDITHIEGWLNSSINRRWNRSLKSTTNCQVDLDLVTVEATLSTERDFLEEMW